MYDLMLYSLKAGACMAVFYLFFKLLLSRETFHRLNRVVLLAAMVLSFVLPLCVITVYRELPALPELPVTPAMYESPAEPQPEPFPWDMVAAAVFLAGAGATLLWTLRSLFGVGRLIRRSRRERLDKDWVLVRTDQAVTPFSWWRYIVLSEKDLAENGEAIIRHEKAHLRLRHSVDLLVTDVAGCLQWFNPAMWLLRRELRAIHEYEADEAVLASGVDAKHYQLLLIRKAAGGRWYSIANSFNHSKLKNRITMMLRKRSSRWAGAKALLLLPLTGIALGAFARTAYVFPGDKSTKNRIIITKSSTEISDGSPLLLVDGREVVSLDSLDDGRIASVSVLKGASATAIYGTRGADGVILVSTKDAGDPQTQAPGDGESAREARDAGKTGVTGYSIGDGNAEAPGGKVIVWHQVDRPETTKEESGNTRRFTYNGDDGRVSVVVTDSASAKKDTTRYKIWSVTKSHAAAGGDEAGNVLWVVDGKETAVRNSDDLDHNRIASIRVLKGKPVAEKYSGRGLDGVIEITTKEAEAKARKAAKGLPPKSVQVTVDGTNVTVSSGETVSATEASLKAAEAGLDAVRAGLKKARRHMSGREWRKAQADLDKAQRELAAARRTSAAELAAAREQIEFAHKYMSGREWKEVQGSDGNSQSHAEAAGPVTTSSQTWHVTTGQGTTRVDHSMTETGKTTFSGQITLHNASEIPDDYLIFINGKKASKADVRRLAPKKIKRMELLRGKENCKEYGADVNGVVRITTRR